MASPHKSDLIKKLLVPFFVFLINAFLSSFFAGWTWESRKEKFWDWEITFISFSFLFCHLIPDPPTSDTVIIAGTTLLFIFLMAIACIDIAALIESILASLSWQKCAKNQKSLKIISKLNDEIEYKLVSATNALKAKTHFLTPRKKKLQWKNCNLVNRLTHSFCFSFYTITSDGKHIRKKTYSTMKFNFLNCFIFRPHSPYPFSSDSCQWGMWEEFHFYVLFMWCERNVKHASLLMLIDVIIEMRKIVLVAIKKFDQFLIFSCCDKSDERRRKEGSVAGFEKLKVVRLLSVFIVGFNFYSLLELSKLSSIFRNCWQKTSSEKRIF